MVDKRLIFYIRSQLFKKVSPKVIRQKLISKGWKPQDVDNAIKAVIQKKTFSSSRKPVSKGPVKPQSSKQAKNTSSLKDKFLKKPNKKTLILFSVLVGIFILLLIFFIMNSSKTVSGKDIFNGEKVDLKASQKLSFDFEGDEHILEIEDLEEEYVNIFIPSVFAREYLEEGDFQDFDLDDDGTDDIRVRLNRIRGGKATFSFENLRDLDRFDLEDSSADSSDDSGCVSKWVCTNWSECSDGMKTRECTDENNCNDLSKKPLESYSCNEGCNTSLECFIQAAGVCNDDEITLTIQDSQSGIYYNQTFYFSINKSSEGDCALYKRLEDIELHYSSELIEFLEDSGFNESEILERVENSTDIAEQSIDSGKICNFTYVDDLISFLEDLKDGFLIEEESYTNDCFVFGDYPPVITNSLIGGEFGDSISDGENCIGPDYISIPNKDGRVYYKDFSGEPCVSEVRTCNSGKLSGSYTASYCREYKYAGDNYEGDFGGDNLCRSKYGPGWKHFTLTSSPYGCISTGVCPESHFERDPVTEEIINSDYTTFYWVGGGTACNSWSEASSLKGNILGYNSATATQLGTSQRCYNLARVACYREYASVDVKDTTGSCDAPEGGIIYNGESRTYYSTSEALCTGQERVCNDGDLSGTYSNAYCYQYKFLGNRSGNFGGDSYCASNFGVGFKVCDSGEIQSCVTRNICPYSVQEDYSTYYWKQDSYVNCEGYTSSLGSGAILGLAEDKTSWSLDKPCSETHSVCCYKKFS